MTEASSLVFAAARRFAEHRAANGPTLSGIYRVLTELASALAVHDVMISVDDELLGRQVFASSRGRLVESEPLFGLSGPPSVWTVPERELDAACVRALVDAVGSAIAHVTHSGRDLLRRPHLGRDELMRVVGEATARAVRYRWGFTLVLVRFEVGDVSSLSKLTEDMRARLRLGDVVEPYRDDGVALVLPATPGDRAPQILHRAAAGGPRLCFGLASSPAESSEAPTLIALAENRLAHAKRLS